MYRPKDLAQQVLVVRPLLQVRQTPVHPVQTFKTLRQKFLR
jgi:hypothetical protein